MMQLPKNPILLYALRMTLLHGLRLTTCPVCGRPFAQLLSCLSAGALSGLSMEKNTFKESSYARTLPTAKICITSPTHHKQLSRLQGYSCAVEK